MLIFLLARDDDLGGDSLSFGLQGVEVTVLDDTSPGMNNLRPEPDDDCLVSEESSFWVEFVANSIALRQSDIVVRQEQQQI